MQISIEIAEKFYEQGRLNEAQEVCEQIVAGDPNDLIALGLLGIILARLEKPEQALSVSGILCFEGARRRVRLLQHGIDLQ